MDKKGKFLQKAEKKYNNKFDYSKVDYKGCYDEVTIICPIHGEFTQTPAAHLAIKYGCPQCGKEEGAKKGMVTKEEFIDRANKVHQYKYDYSLIEYRGLEKKVSIVCPIHGVFKQSPIQHLRSKVGCQLCAIEKSKLKSEEFIEKANKKHNNKYDYSLVEYENRNTPIWIICPIHGKFSQTPNSHLYGHGCPECNLAASKTTESFIKEAKQIHEDNYDYSNTEYVNYKTKLTVTCPRHGNFSIVPYRHLKGSGCPSCTQEKRVIYTYDFCYRTALKYETLYSFRKNEHKTYVKAYDAGWIKDYTWLKKDFDNVRLQTVYVYEFDDNSAYVGLTNNLNRRDYQHRIPQYTQNGTKKKDSVLEYSVEHNIEIPEVKILKSGLTREESQIEEQRYIKEYKKNGWNMINKNRGGSLGCNGSDIIWTKDLIIEESKRYEYAEQMRKNSRTAYNKMMEMKLDTICFPNKRKVTLSAPYTYTEEFLNHMKQKYPLKKDLRKHEYRVYQWLHNHKRLHEFYQ